MTRLTSLALLATLAAPAWAQAPAEEPAAAARGALDAIEAEAAGLKRGANAAGNALLQRCHQVRLALWGAAGKADRAWAAQLKRCEALDRRIQAACTGQPVAAGAADAPTQEAAAKLDQVEAALAGLKPRDGAAASALVKTIDEAKALLMSAQVPARASDAWIDGLARSRDLDARVRARHAEAAAAGPADAGPPRAGERPPAAPTALSASDGWALRKDFYPAWDDAVAQLERTETADLGLARFSSRFRGDVRRMLAAIEAVREQAHPDVAWCRRRLAAFNERLEARIAEGVGLQQQRRADAKAAVEEVNARLAALQAFFDPRAFRCDLEPPFTLPRIEAWAAEQKKWREVARTGQAEMEGIRARHPHLAKEPAVEEMQRRFAGWLPGALNDALARATGWGADGARVKGGRLRELLERAEADAAGGIPDEHLSDDAWVTGILDRVRLGIVAAQGLRAVARTVLGKDEPGLGAQADRLRAFLADVEVRGAKVLQQTRLPRPASTDERLLKLARECLAGTEFGAGERLVLLSTPTRQEAKRSDSWTEGDYVYIRTWTEVWEELQVAAAEKVGEHHRIVTYTLKYVHRSAGMKPEGRWYCHDRFEGPRILPENIGK